jgi:hypothetical protein
VHISAEASSAARLLPVAKANARAATATSSLIFIDSIFVIFSFFLSFGVALDC